MLGRLRQMLIKELIQVFRDKRPRAVLLGPPIIQMLIFGYAATLEIRHVPMAILDYDHTRVSRDLVARFAASPYFDVSKHLVRKRQIEELIDRGEITMALQINSGFARDLEKGKTAHLQVILDSSNSNTALVGLGYVNEVTGNFAQDYRTAILRRTSPHVVTQLPRVILDRRPWYNTDLSSQWFFVPGVIGNLMLIIFVNLTAFAVVREREIVTLEQIMVTPIRRVEFILGKTLPFFLLGLLDAVLVSAFGTLWFGVPLRGSLGVLALGTVLFLICMLGVGLLISTVSATQQQAMVTSFILLMPAIIFSGFATPVSSIPEVLQKLTYLNPARQFQDILRHVFLKGGGLDILWPQMAALAALGFLMLTVSVFRFQKSLD